MTWRWADLADHLGCACQAADAWRCARAQGIFGQIACVCKCHRYDTTEKGERPS